MLKIKKAAMSAFESLIAGNHESPLSQNLKLKKHECKVSFNAPQNPET